MVEDVNLPHFYRWLLKIPIPDFFDWLARRRLFTGLLAYGFVLGGIFVLMMLPVPIMVFTYLLVGFPLCVILGLLIPAVITILWTRAQMERAYNYWKSLQLQQPQRNIEEAINGYLKILAAQAGKKGYKSFREAKKRK